MNRNKSTKTTKPFPSYLPRPAQRALASAGFTKLEQLSKIAEKEILQLHGMGQKALTLIRKDLEGKGKGFAKENGPGKSSVAAFINNRVLPEHRPIVAMIRQLMRETAPNAKELISYGILAWKGKRMLAVISPTKKDITFAFSRGAEFEDKYGLLSGVGRVSRHIKLKNLKDVDKNMLRYYIKQALKADSD